MSNKNIYVTQPVLPDLGEFNEYLKKIWKDKILTNNGQFHQQFEKKLADFLGIKYISVFANGTLALVTALQALRITGEVITTPFSFVATAHALWWNNIKPVFVDIEPDTFTLDPKKIESAITPQTTAIMPVHVYGNPCRVREIQRIAKTYGLKVIYDAAHAFNVKINKSSILKYGDLSILSFHATKVFNTIEGGAIISHNVKIKQQIDYLKNFGYAGETVVIGPGINAKMNEIQAAYGLLQLKTIDADIKSRKRVTLSYRCLLNGVNGLHFLNDVNGIQHNYAYFPILIDPNQYGLDRDEVYDLLKDHKIFSRKYFFPLISNFPTYQGLVSAHPSNLPIATKIANRILCLPIYPELSTSDVQYICNIIIKKGR